MINNKGLTLIEVIMTVFILGLITMIFLPSTWTSYKNMKKAEEISASILTAQKEADASIEEAKDNIYEYNKDNSKPNPMISLSTKIFDKTIKGVLVKEPVKKKDDIEEHGHFYTFVGDEPIEITESSILPVVEKAKINNKDDRIIMYWNETSNLAGTYEIKNNDKTNYFMSLTRWYSSDDGFYGFIPDSGAGEHDMGTKYPVWPSSYKIEKNDDMFGYNKEQIDDLSRFINKHIVFSAIPLALNGQYGTEIGSKEVYIMGPPILNNNLTFHFDSYTLRDRNGNFYSDGTLISYGDTIKDYSTYRSVDYTDRNKRMLISNVDDGRAVVFENSEAKINHNPTTDMNNFTIFIVYKSPENEIMNQNIIKRYSSTNSGWELALNNNKLVFKVKKTSSDMRCISQNGDLNVSEKYIMIAKTQNNVMKFTLYNNEDKEEGVSNSYINTNSTYGSLYIGDVTSNEYIYEAIIYNKALTDSEINEVRDYLGKKHKIVIKD